MTKSGKVYRIVYYLLSIATVIGKTHYSLSILMEYYEYKNQKLNLLKQKKNHLFFHTSQNQQNLKNNQLFFKKYFLIHNIFVFKIRDLFLIFYYQLLVGGYCKIKRKYSFNQWKKSRVNRYFKLQQQASNWSKINKQPINS